mgnify:CR=1 FL=1|jgi:hypothetical protein
MTNGLFFHGLLHKLYYMRIAISGTACQGKSTLVTDFLQEWPIYTSPDKTYRDVLDIDNHSEGTDEDNQWDILNFMVDQLQEHRKGDNVIFDRCPLDNLVYTLWAHEKGNLSKEFVDKCIPVVKESMRFLDIIFFVPLTNVHKVDIEEDGVRNADPVYIQEIDNIFKTLLQYYYQDVGPFFVKDDKPAIIEVFGDPLERIEMVKLYLDVDGDPIGEQGIIDPNEVESLLQQFRGGN